MRSQSFFFPMVATPQQTGVVAESFQQQLAQNLQKASGVPIPAPIAADAANSFLASNAPLPIPSAKRASVGQVSRGRGRGRGAPRHQSLTSSPPVIPPKPKF